MVIKEQQLKREVIKTTKSHKELQESNDKFKAYIHKSPVGIFVADSSGR